MVFFFWLLLAFTFSIIVLSVLLGALNIWFYWWILFIFLIPPWGLYGYRVVYVTRDREYNKVEINEEKRVRFDLHKNIIHTIS